MRKSLTIVLAITVVCGLTFGISRAQASPEASEAPLDEVVVTGEYPGPGMWQVRHPDHPGHTLWIVGEPPLLPSGIRVRSQNVERVALQSQEILRGPGLGLKPDKKVGMFRMLTLVPAALKLRKNPDEATLKDLVTPEIYARWLVQKKLYLGRSSGVEKMRPFLAAEKLRNAAGKELRIGYGGSWGNQVWAAVGKKKIPVTTPTLEFTFKTENLRGQIKSFARQKLADEDCFARTVELTEALSDKPMVDARAHAWATGDLVKLQQLPPLPDPDLACEKAIIDGLAMATPIPADIRQQLDELWLAAAGTALSKNDSTLAFLQMRNLLGEHGYLETLRQRGYEILPPDAE